MRACACPHLPTLPITFRELYISTADLSSAMCVQGNGSYSMFNNILNAAPQSANFSSERPPERIVTVSAMSGIYHA